LAWDCEQDRLTPLGAVDAALHSIVPTPGGRLIGATAQDVGILHLGDGSCEYVPKLNQPNPKFLQVAGHALYWAAEDEVLEMPLAELNL